MSLIIQQFLAGIPCVSTQAVRLAGTVCTISLAPMRRKLWRHAAACYPTLKNGHCRWFDKVKVMTMAVGFSHLYDNVLKSDFTSMRKTITAYLHGVKFYYQYMRGERPLTPAQQQGIRDIIKSYGYDWDVPFDGYHKAYCFGNPPTD